MKTIFPWQKQDTEKVLSYKLYGIDLLTLGPNLYLDLWGSLKGIDETNTISNILISPDGKTLLIVLLCQNNNTLVDSFSYTYFLKFRAEFSLIYCTQEDVNEIEFNQYKYNNEIFHTLYLVPDIPANLEYIWTWPMWFPHEVPNLLKGGRSVHRIKYPILGEDDEIMSTESTREKLKFLNPWENFPHKIVILKL